MDALQERSPFEFEAKEILRRAQNREFSCLFTANAAADIFYLYSKARDTKSARTALDFLLTHYGIVSVTHEDCKSALSLPMEDFEDALDVVCAQRIGADYIVTRDKEFLQADSPVKLIEPREFIDVIDSI
jgi:predicted nucleic acid-binding protein